MDILLGREREIGIISIISIIVFSNGLLFYIQNITADKYTKSVFEQQRQLQIQSTGEIAQHVSSDVSLVMSMLYGLANSHYVHKGNWETIRLQSCWMILIMHIILQ